MRARLCEGRGRTFKSCQVHQFENSYGVAELERRESLKLVYVGSNPTSVAKVHRVPLALIQIYLERFILDNYVVGDMKDFPYAWISEGFLAIEYSAQYLGVLPGTVRSISNRNLILVVGGSEIESESFTLTRIATLTPFPQRYDHLNDPIGMVVREHRIVDGVRIIVAINEPSKSCRDSTATLACRSGWILELEGEHAVKIIVSTALRRQDIISGI